MTDTLKRTKLNEVLALALALGPTKFVAGPLAMIVDLVTAGGVLEFYTYLVLARGKLSSLIDIGEVLFKQNGQKYTDHLFKMRASGLFVGVDQAQSLHYPDTQLPRENAGFPMPQQLADLTLAEVEDLVPVIFGPLGLLRYRTKPVSMAIHVATVSIFTYLQGSSPKRKHEGSHQGSHTESSCATKEVLPCKLV